MITALHVIYSLLAKYKKVNNSTLQNMYFPTPHPIQKEKEKVKKVRFCFAYVKFL